MQVGRNSVGRSEHFSMVAVYGLNPNDFVFTIADSGRCYPAFVILLGPLAWPPVTQRNFWTKHESRN